ncbi:hypothetical protein LINGRAHAP2_LOCUS4738 [Linum grandiflorum]
MTSFATDQTNLTTKEEDDELFEIDIDALPSPRYWEINCNRARVSSAISSTDVVALFANCLLPVAHVSSAIPMPFSAVSSSSLACGSVISPEEQLLLCRLHRRNFQLLAFQDQE